MSDKRILVTGGAGFVGSHIVDQLLEEGCGRITVIDNMVRGRPENLDKLKGSVELIEGDICDRNLMERLIRHADIVFHQAALRITHCAAEPRVAMQVMVDATFDILELCARFGVQKVVAASSASIYGMAEHFPIEESHHPYNNRTLYGAAKAFNEGLLRCFNDMYGLPYVALRYFNVYGPRMDIHGKYTEVLIRWMECIDAGVRPTIFGDGLQTMDFVHVRDVARANVFAARADVDDAVFNIGSGMETSLINLLRALLRAMGREDLKPQFGSERKVNAVTRRLSSTEAARRRLGFEASIPLDAGLSDLVEWWRRERVRGTRQKEAVA
ncbi:MAG TPA: NAD-dependent epimerase/dehydratase family protein [Pseudolabrys sp.]|nr:NAD-dependent epimerase/dehydratase family protein [Pseudolabrys sp.]